MRCADQQELPSRETEKRGDSRKVMSTPAVHYVLSVTCLIFVSSLTHSPIATFLSLFPFCRSLPLRMSWEVVCQARGKKTDAAAASHHDHHHIVRGDDDAMPCRHRRKGEENDMVTGWHTRVSFVRRPMLWRVCILGLRIHVFYFRTHHTTFHIHTQTFSSPFLPIQQLMHVSIWKTLFLTRDTDKICDGGKRNFTSKRHEKRKGLHFVVFCLMSRVCAIHSMWVCECSHRSRPFHACRCRWQWFVSDKKLHY